MQNSLITVLPPILVIFLAYLTHRIVTSLLIGILVSSLIYNNFAIIDSIKNVLNVLWNTTEIGNLTSLNGFLESSGIMLFIFLLILGAIITLLTYSGSAEAFQNYINKKIKTAKGAQTASLLISNLFSIDDSFGCVSVGAIMHPITDKFKIARTKLAFLVNSLAPTMTIIVPISSWSAVIVSNISSAKVSTILKTKPLIFSDPFYLYLGVIPFIFYSFIMITAVWFMVKYNISFGLLKKHENIAETTGNLFGGREHTPKKTKRSDNTESHIIDFVLPIVFLISSILIFILYTGHFALFGGHNNLLQAIQQGKPVLALMFGGLLTFIFSSIFLIAKKSIKITDIFHITIEGFMLLLPSICVLILAWAFADILNHQLLTGNYLAYLLLKYINIKLLPVLFFIITLITAVGISSAWGAMAITIPIAINILASFFSRVQPIPVADIPIIYPLLGAILSGAVSGNHISPASDTIIITARSCGIPFIDLVRAQSTYSIPPLICTAFAFLISGFLVGVLPLKFVLLISLGSGILLNFLILKFKNSNKN